MARKSRKKSLAQQVVGTAAVGMPEPVKKAVSTRWGARIALVAAVLLFVSGIVTVQWSDYRPHLKINRERAEEVKEAIVDRARSWESKKPTGAMRRASSAAAPTDSPLSSAFAAAQAQAKIGPPFVRDQPIRPHSADGGAPSASVPQCAWPGTSPLI